LRVISEGSPSIASSTTCGRPALASRSWLVRICLHSSAEASLKYQGNANHISKETMFRQLRADATVESTEWDQSARFGEYLDFVCVNIGIHDSDSMRASVVGIEYCRTQIINRVIVFSSTEVRMLDNRVQARKITALVGVCWDSLLSKSCIPTEKFSAN
jgi:hypothetical protein